MVMRLYFIPITDRNNRKRFPKNIKISNEILNILMRHGSTLSIIIDATIQFFKA